MGGYRDPIQDLIDRSLRNLYFVYDRAPHPKYEFPDDNRPPHALHNAGPFEVTQLLNTFLGALIHPWEDLKSRGVRDLDIDLRQARRLDFPMPQDNRTTGKTPKTYKDLLRLIRNAFAHGNCEVKVDKHNVINEVKIWNECQSCNQPTWETTLTIDELCAFVNFFASLSTQIQEPEPEAEVLQRGAAD